MEEKLRNSFKEIGTNEKRDELSLELMKISSIINERLEKHGKKDLELAYDYDPDQDQTKTEDEMLTIFYMDILKIEDNLTTLFMLEDIDSEEM